MKIGMHVPVLGFQGGLERYAFEMARSFVAAGHDVALLHGAGRGRDVETFTEPFSSIVPDDGRRPLPPLDVVFVQKPTLVEDLERFRATPLVFAAHDHDLTCARSHRYLPLTNEPCDRSPGVGCVTRGCIVVRRRQGFPLAVVDPFRLRRDVRALAARGPLVACSEYVARGLREAGARADRVHVVHPILPATASAPAPRPARRRLVACGQLLRGKGFDIAIAALAYLPGDVVLRIVGDGPARDELQALANKRVPGRVEFAGYLAPDAIDAAYDDASVVVVPSRWPEPFGMIGLEAMRRGRPVVGARHGGIPEWLLEGGGRLFDPLDPRDLAAQVLDVLHDPSSEAGALACAARFRHEDSVAALLRILEEAAHPRTRAARSLLREAS